MKHFEQSCIQPLLKRTCLHMKKTQVSCTDEHPSQRRPLVDTVGAPQNSQCSPDYSGNSEYMNQDQNINLRHRHQQK